MLLANMVAVSQYILTVSWNTDNISRGRGVATLPNVRLVCHSKEKVEKLANHSFDPFKGLN